MLQFNLQLFADTAPTEIEPSLRLEAWAKSTWSAGLQKSFFNKFTGNSAENIIQIKEELAKDAGDTIHIPLLMPLTGAGVAGDETMEGNEESLIYRDFTVTIDQIRNAVRLKGRMEEKKVLLDLRKDARTALSKWLADYIDKKIFAELTNNPSADRIVFGGTATSEGSIGAADSFSTKLIGKAKRIALADENTMVKPLRVDGIDTYIMIIDQWQARDLMADEIWINAQQHANIRGKDNPIFSGALGMYDGVIIHQCNRIPRTETGSGGTKVGHALFLGAQAAVFAIGGNPTWEEDSFDYRNKWGASFGRIFGIKKAQFKYDGENFTDFGCVNILTASEDDQS